ncbi:MAG: hypothetical protein JW928_02940 [Candidatus Aureabacteria bacterium]|nr:hypothetical protein [Candidatus Auribacterota bacterium]
MRNKFLIKFFYYVFLPIVLILLTVNFYLEYRENNIEKEIAHLISIVDNKNFGDVVKQLSAYTAELRDPVIVSNLDSHDFLHQQKIINLIAFFQIKEAFPHLIELFKKTDKDLIAYEVVLCFKKLDDKAYSKPMMDLLKSQGIISSKKKEYLISLASQYATPETLGILSRFFDDRDSDNWTKISASCQMQKISEPVLLEKLEALFGSESDRDKMILKEVLMRLEKSPDATFVVNKFLLERAEQVDEVFLFYTFRLFDKESVDVLLVMGQEEEKKGFTLYFLSRLAGRKLKTIEEAKDWWKSIDQDSFFASFSKDIEN